MNNRFPNWLPNWLPHWPARSLVPWQPQGLQLPSAKQRREVWTKPGSIQWPDFRPQRQCFAKKKDQTPISINKKNIAFVHAWTPCTQIVLKDLQPWISQLDVKFSPQLPGLWAPGSEKILKKKTVGTMEIQRKESKEPGKWSHLYTSSSFIGWWLMVIQLYIISTGKFVNCQTEELGM